MNLILLNSLACKQRLTADDRRTRHIRDTLLRGNNATFYVGVVGEMIGLAHVELEADGSVLFSIDWNVDAPAENAGYPIHLMVGMCRPQTCRKILKDAASLGISSLFFFNADRGEPSYAESSLWQTGEWHRLLLEGIEQSFSVHLPLVERFDNLEQVLVAMKTKYTQRIALDLYECDGSLAPLDTADQEVCLALGSERGWSDRERCLLRSHRFVFKRMGRKVMRTETAVIAATSVIASQMHWTGKSFNRLEDC